MIAELSGSCTPFVADWMFTKESAGKRKSGRSPVRKHHLKTIMTEVAWAAIKKKDSYFKDKYYRLKARRGAKRAIVAIAHRILLGIYHVIKDGADFRDLGGDYLTLRNKSQKVFIYGSKRFPWDSIWSLRRSNDQCTEKTFILEVDYELKPTSA